MLPVTLVTAVVPKMNKKGDIEISIKTLIGFVLVAIVLVAFVGFFIKLWGIFTSQPNEATLNSFKNLVYEINTLEEGKDKVVPFFIQDGLFLYTSCEAKYGKSILNDICICTANCEKKFSQEIITWIKDQSQQVTISGNSITYLDDKHKVRNLKLVRNNAGVTISDCEKLSPKC